MPEIETYTPAQLETEVQTLAENYRGAVAEIAEDDRYFDDISTAIQGKTGQAEPYAKNEMAGAIANISPIPEKPNPNGALLLIDWEGTILQSYTHAEAMALEALPNVEDTPYYPLVDHELLEFQEWNWTLEEIKEHFTENPYGQLIVGATYTTIDGQDYKGYSDDRVMDNSHVTWVKRSTNSLGTYAYRNYSQMEAINLPKGLTTIGLGAFSNCFSLKALVIPRGTTTITGGTWGNCRDLQYISMPKSLRNYNGSGPDIVIRAINFTVYHNLISMSGNVHLKYVYINNYINSIGGYTFYNTANLNKIDIPSSVNSIGAYAFNSSGVVDMVIRGTPALSNVDAFGATNDQLKLYVHRSDLSWFKTATNWSTIYAQGKIVAAADYLEHLISIGIDVTDFESEVITT